VARYVSEAWFGWRLRRPPAYRQAPGGPAQPWPAYPGQPVPARPARHRQARTAGVALIVIGAVLLLAVSNPIPFLNAKLLGLILIVTGLVKVRALQRASGWLWRNRREVMTALDAPPDEIEAPRVPLDALLVSTAPVPRLARRRARRQAARSEHSRRPGRRLGRPGRRFGRLGQRRGHRRADAGQLVDAADAR
jgi:hypothetical protein